MLPGGRHSLRDRSDPSRSRVRVRLPLARVARAGRIPAVVRRGAPLVLALVLAACATTPPRIAEPAPPVSVPDTVAPRIVASPADSASAESPAVIERRPETPRSAADSALAALAGRRLLVPVSGVEAARILDSFSAPRGARTHNALDIMAPRGTPVVSADDGTVLRVSENRAGGLTVYTTDPDRRLVYYYAHMDRYADGLAAGRSVARGDTLGYVGTTGNAPRDIPHLHFQMMLMHPEGRYWAGTPVNPLPFLLAATETDEPDE